MSFDISQVRAELYPVDRPAAAPAVAPAPPPAREPAVREAAAPEPVPPAPPAAAPAAAVPWLDPRIAGRAALGSTEEQMRTLVSLHALFSQRTDPVARNAAAVLHEEVRNHLVLNGQLNSLVE